MSDTSSKPERPAEMEDDTPPHKAEGKDLSAKRKRDEDDDDDDEEEEDDEEEDEDDEDGNKKKRRHRFTNDERMVMLEYFTRFLGKPPAEEITTLSQKLGLEEKRVKVWFNNERAQRRRRAAKEAGLDSSEQATPSKKKARTEDEPVDDAISQATSQVVDGFEVFNVFVDSLSKRQLRQVLAHSVVPCASKRLLRQLIFQSVAADDKNRTSTVQAIEKMLQLAVETGDQEAGSSR